MQWHPSTRPPRATARDHAFAALRPDRGGGARLLAAALAAAAHLAAHVDEVDALNVFPVPDGDTGTNMLATVRAAIDAAHRIPDDERTLGRMAQALSHGSLMGARGNSGVILSQILRGMAEAVAGAESIDGQGLAAAFASGSHAARAAIGTPVEGTMLTVMRDTAEAAAGAAGEDPGLLSVLEASVVAARESVARTPDLLPILRQAGVVDAGGHGLALLLSGALASLTGVIEEADDVPLGHPALDAIPSHADDGFGFESVFLVEAEDRPLVLADVRRHLETLGDSVVVAGDERMMKIHVHSERPDDVLAYGQGLGSVRDLSVVDLSAGARSMRDRQAHPGAAEGTTTMRMAIVAVARGEGFIRLFEATGAMVVVAGEAIRASVGELLMAIDACEASDVVVLPNDANVLLAAQHAAEARPGIDVVIVPTRNMAEGIAATLAADPTSPMTINAERMLRASRTVRTLAVTEASRDAVIGDHPVRRGDTLVLDPDDGIVASGRDPLKTIVPAVVALWAAPELITVYCGETADDAASAGLVQQLRDALPDTEVELVDGGQAHHRYLIAAE